MSASSQVAHRRILLVRHGHYERSAGGDDTVWGLSELGRHQAERTGRRLAQIVNSTEASFEGLFSSPWPRALQTAEIAAHEMRIDRIKIKPYLHEVFPIVDEHHSPAFGGPVDLPLTTQEEREATVKQIDKIRERFFRPPTRASLTVLFTHGNVIRYLVADALGLPYEAWLRMEHFHCGVTEIRVFTSGEAVLSFSSVGHLAGSYISSTGDR